MIFYAIFVFNGCFTLQEADYCMALFHYLLLHGNAGDSISILTPYNKQKRLLSSKFSHLPDQMDSPRDISTIDEFQGQKSEKHRRVIEHEWSIDRGDAMHTYNMNV
jgi:hypothetical protein